MPRELSYKVFGLSETEDETPFLIDEFTVIVQDDHLEGEEAWLQADNEAVAQITEKHLSSPKIFKAIEFISDNQTRRVKKYSIDDF